MRKRVEHHENRESVGNCAERTSTAKREGRQCEQGDHRTDKSREPSVELEDRNRRPRDRISNGLGCWIVDREEVGERLISDVDSESQGEPHPREANSRSARSRGEGLAIEFLRRAFAPSGPLLASTESFSAAA